MRTNVAHAVYIYLRRSCKILNPLLHSRVSFLRDHATTYACGTNCRSAGQDFLSRESIFRARFPPCRIPVQRVHYAWPIRVCVMIFLAIELTVERRYPRRSTFRPLADNFSTRRVLLLSLSIPLLWAAAAVSDLRISRCAFLIHFPCTIPREGLRSSSLAILNIL